MMVNEQQCYVNCSYLPLELLALFNLKAGRPWPQGIVSGRKELLPNDFCSYSRAFLEVSQDETVFPVLANCCDAMRRVYDLLKKDSLLIEIPRRIDEQGVNYFYKQLQKILSVVGVDNQPGELRFSLEKEVAKYNNWRQLLQELRDDILKEEGSFSLLLEGIELFYQGRGDKLAALREMVVPLNSQKMPRVMLVSSTLLEAGLVRLMETSGLLVVGLDSCPGERSFERGIIDIKDNEDLLKSLARSYLSGPGCPRMMDGKKRWEEIYSLFDQRRADGIIYFLPKFCDQAAYDFKHIKEEAVKKGIPVLQLEGEYNNSHSGQFKTRVTAFRESLLIRNSS